MKRIPLLTLLHAGTAKVKRAKKPVSSVSSMNENTQRTFTFDISKLTEDSRPASGTYRVYRHTASYIFRNMRRDVGKTVLSLILVIILAAGIGMFALARSSYRNAFTNVEVKGNSYTWRIQDAYPVHDGVRTNFNMPFRYYHWGWR